MRQLLMLILVDGYQDAMLLRTTMISGGGGCKDLWTLACPPARTATTQLGEQATWTKKRNSTTNVRGDML